MYFGCISVLEFSFSASDLHERASLVEINLILFHSHLETITLYLSKHITGILFLDFVIFKNITA